MHVTSFGAAPDSTPQLLICLHGWGMSGAVEQADFEPFFAHRPGWTRLYIDLPGMGLTPADPHITDVESMLSALLMALPEWTQGRPFALSGTSAGAYLARGLVAAVPERVMGLLLRVPRVVPDGQPRTLPPETTLIEDRTFQDTVRLLTPDERDALSGTPVQRPAYVQATLHQFRTVIAPALAQNDKAVLDAIREDPVRYSFRVPPEQRPFAAPTLIITGRQDQVVGYQDAWELLPHYPRATYVALDRAGHDWPLPEGQQQRLFTALVHDWLDRIEEAQAPS
ncbi:alpha/beta fold hydrolase [Deinococcus yunweiensis]|uniref:alpha/beta fold hydrolase n=1 Tax=Deinococcus yunweiensis TaxID=367282 RepID=UPI00398E3722